MRATASCDRVVFCGRPLSKLEGLGSPENNEVYEETSEQHLPTQHKALWVLWGVFWESPAIAAWESNHSVVQIPFSLP